MTCRAACVKVVDRWQLHEIVSSVAAAAQAEGHPLHAPASCLVGPQLLIALPYCALFPKALCVVKMTHVHNSCSSSPAALAVLMNAEYSRMMQAFYRPVQSHLLDCTGWHTSCSRLQISGDSTDAQELAQQAGVSCPCIAKPQAACGVGKAHVMSIIFNNQGFGALARHQGPMLVQQFIPHAGFLHKVYVIGAKVGPVSVMLYSSR